MNFCNCKNASLFSLGSLNLSYTTEYLQLMHLRTSMNNNLIKEENEQLIKVNETINCSVLLLKK